MTKISSMTLEQAFNNAVALMNSGQYEQAKDICLQIRKVRPKVPDVHHLLGGIAFKLGDREGAADHFSQVVRLNPDHIEARTNLVKMLRDLNRWKEAEAHLTILARGNADDAAILKDLAKAQVQIKKYDEALSTLQRALSSHDAPHIIQCEIADVHAKKGELDKAAEVYLSVLKERPHFVPALQNLSVIRDIQNRMDDALRLQQTAAEAEPENADARTHFALSLLARENFDRGWSEYNWRLHRTQTSTLHGRFDAPYWNGEPLEDQCILVWTEQGPGDEILISSMLPDVLVRCKKCIVVCTERLAPIFERSFENVEVFTREAVLKGNGPTEAPDFQASLSHLGAQLRTAPDSFPHHHGYLRADDGLIAELREMYRADQNQPLIGISWHSANLAPDAAERKSTLLQDWKDILLTPNVKFVSLQYGDHDREITNAKKHFDVKIVRDKSVDPLVSMDRFAAQVAAMDLVISVSNTTVHVAGALDKPVWTMVPASLGRIWYWFLERDTSLWYPSMRLYRQDHGTSWDRTIGAIAHELKLWKDKAVKAQ